MCIACKVYPSKRYLNKNIRMLIMRDDVVAIKTSKIYAVLH